MRMDFLSALKQRPLMLDGAMGTMLQRYGLKPGGCPDELALKEPDLVKKVHGAYFNAGSDIVTTNTFGANRVKLREYNLEGKLREINIAAVECAMQAVGDIFVAGDIGPTGRFVEPLGDMSFDEAYDVFKEQAEALKEGGADLLIIETMMDIKEMRAAIIAAKTTGLPVIATMTFDQTMRTVLGTPPESFAIMAASLGADVVGANCSLGIEGILKAVTAMRRVVDVPLIAQANAGMPVLKGKETVFPASPESMAGYVNDLVDVGVTVLGGCCGTTPEHIRLMNDVFKGLRPVRRKEAVWFTGLSSRTSYTVFGGTFAPVVIGERINPTGRRSFADEIKSGKTAAVRNEARSQTEFGAHLLDVNVGVPGIDEASFMKKAVFAVNDNCSLPIVIDSSSTEALEAGLKAVDGKPLINSISGETKKLDTILPLVKKYGASVLALTLDDNGIPDKAEDRLKIAEEVLNRALQAGLRMEDLVIDCLAMTVSAAPESALETLKAIRLVKEKLGLSTALGVSNISFGLPDRSLLNSSFLTMAIAAGLDAAIINPGNKAMMDAYHASLVMINRDQRAEHYIRRFQKNSSPDAAPGAVVENKELTLEEKIKRAVIEGDENHIVSLVEEALGKKWDPMKISNDCLVPGLEEVGRLFSCNRYYLPQVMLSAETMKKAFGRLKKEFKGKAGSKPLAKVVLATVEGDVHDIGKNIVATLLENHGFEVIDLGKNVPSDRIIEEALRVKADIVGLSALMTTTVMEMDVVIKKLKERGIKALTIVGGAVVTKEFSEKIGATEYGGDALSAIEKIKAMIKAG